MQGEETAMRHGQLSRRALGVLAISFLALLPLLSMCWCVFCKDYALIMGRKFPQRPWAVSKSLQNWLLSAHKMCKAGNRVLQLLSKGA